MDTEIWDRFNEQIKANQFELRANTPEIWMLISNNLKRAADKLYDCYYQAVLRDNKRFLDESHNNHANKGRPELKGDELEDFYDGQLIFVYFLLIGYAIENLLKAMLLLEHPEYFKPNEKITDIKSHDLVRLCQRNKILLEPEETNLLEKLTTYIEWQGKYPIPLESEKMFPIKQTDGSWKQDGENFRKREPQEEVDKLYIMIWEDLKNRHVSKIRSKAST